MLGVIALLLKLVLVNLNGIIIIFSLVEDFYMLDALLTIVNLVVWDGLKVVGKLVKRI